MKTHLRQFDAMMPNRTGGLTDEADDFLHSMFVSFLMAGYFFFCQQLYAAEKAELREGKIIVSSNAIRAPVGVFTLVRRGSDYCAIKIMETWADKKGRGYYAKYEAYYQGDGSGDFGRKSVIKTTDELADLQPIPIIGRLSISRGETSIYCGDMTISTSGYLGSAWLYFGEQKDMLLAPTAKKSLADIDVSDNKLVWYGYDAHRSDITIPTSE